MKNKCQLCVLIKNPDSKIFFENKKIIIIKNYNNSNYNIKYLCIWKEHKSKLSSKELYYFINLLIEIRKKLNLETPWWDIIIGLRSIPNHFHMHLGQLIN